MRTDGSGVELARRGIDRLTSEGALARMPYWLSLLADLMTRGGRQDAARATLDAAIAGGRAHDDVWWMPEVMRMRARAEGPSPERWGNGVFLASPVTHPEGPGCGPRRYPT